jgi:hypothetical protein
VKIEWSPRLMGAAVIAVLTTLVAQGVLTGTWQSVAVAAIAGVSALLVPSGEDPPNGG